jgi:hypothetical protein
MCAEPHRDVRLACGSCAHVFKCDTRPECALLRRLLMLLAHARVAQTCDQSGTRPRRSLARPSSSRRERHVPAQPGTRGAAASLGADPCDALAAGGGVECADQEGPMRHEALEMPCE